MKGLFLSLTNEKVEGEKLAKSVSFYNSNCNYNNFN